MIRVIIADDEVRICRLIQVLIDWEGLGMEIAGVASNGLEALSLIKKERPDILITDIRMPGCGGLELVEKAHDILSNLQIVIISGYANFAYAQMATGFGVRHYLLKPINQEELLGVMTALKENIEEMQKEAALYADEKLSQKKDAKRLRRLMVERLINIQAPPITEEMYGEQYHFPIREGMFLGFCLGVDEKDREKCREIMGACEERMVQIFDAGLKNHCFDWSCYQHHYTIYGVLNSGAGNGEEIKKVLRDCLNQMNTQKHLFGDAVFTLGVGTLEKNPESLKVSLQNARTALRERLLQGTGKMIVYEEKQSSLYEKKLLDYYSREIDHVLEVRSEEDLAAANERLARDVLSTKGLLGVELFDIVVEAGNMFVVRLNLQEKAKIIKQFTEDLNCCYQAGQLFDTLLSFEKKLLGERMEQYQDAKRPVRLAKQYIQNHYMEQISLEGLSEQVGLSPAYFSALFKKETEIGFSKYLTNVRMEQAKILLRETHLPVWEVCKKVGYNDVRHFTQTFDKLMGVKPAVFRKLYG